MRFNTYDNVLVQPSAVSSVVIQSLTGSSAVNGDAVETAVAFPAENAMVHVRAEIASGTPSAAAVAWKLQESDNNSDWADAKDNTGTVIGATLDVKTAAKDSYARVEGIMLNRSKYLRVVLTPAFTAGTSPAILAFAEILGIPGDGGVLPVRTTVSNT